MINFYNICIIIFVCTVRKTNKTSLSNDSVDESISLISDGGDEAIVHDMDTQQPQIMKRGMYCMMSLQNPLFSYFTGNLVFNPKHFCFSMWKGSYLISDEILYKMINWSLVKSSIIWPNNNYFVNFEE